MKVNDEVKRQAMNAITNVETAARVGMVKLTGVVGLYVARIREADREAGTAPRKVRRDVMGREL
jgi:hypothetical protein